MVSFCKPVFFTHSTPVVWGNILENHSIAIYGIILPQLYSKIALLDQLIQKIVVQHTGIDIYWTFSPVVDD
jgi:hypothetical protein